MRQNLFSVGPDTARCLKLFLYWPVYGLLFYLAEDVFRPTRYHIMYCRLDDLIPFCEGFVLPYLFWFVYLIGIHVYTFLYEKEAFQKLMKFIIVSYSVALLIFFLYPNCQLLRPAVFPRDNALTDLVALFYRMDTNTNVCPSLHVVGSLAVWYTARETRLFQHRGWRLFFHLATPLVCVSTVFLKQHSVLDLVAGVLVSWAAWTMVGIKVDHKAPRRAYCVRKKMSY